MKAVLATIFIGLIATTFAAVEPKCPEDGSGNELLADPEDCEKFWYCLNYIPHPAYCPRPQYFDVKTLTCIEPEKAECAGPRPGAPEIPEVPEQPSFPEEPIPPSVYCPEQMKPTDNILLPNPKDCGSFYQCVYGYPHLLHCPNGLHFNNRRKICDWPELAKCTVQH